MTTKPYTDAELVNLSIRAAQRRGVQTSEVVPRLVAELRQARAALAQRESAR